MAQEDEVVSLKNSDSYKHLQKTSNDFALAFELVVGLQQLIESDRKAPELPHPNDFIEPSDGDRSVLKDMQVEDIAEKPPSTVERLLELGAKIQDSLEGKDGTEILTKQQLQEIAECGGFVEDLNADDRIDGSIACFHIEELSKIIVAWNERVVGFCMGLVNFSSRYDDEEKNYKEAIVEMEELLRNRQHKKLQVAKKEFVDNSLKHLDELKAIREGLLKLDISIDLSKTISQTGKEIQLAKSDFKRFREIAKKDRAQADAIIKSLHQTIAHLINLLKENRLRYDKIQQTHPKTRGKCDLREEDKRIRAVLDDRSKIREDCDVIPPKIAHNKGTILLLTNHVKLVGSVQDFYERKLSFAKKINKMVNRIDELIRDCVETFNSQLNAQLEKCEMAYCDIFARLHEEISMTLETRRRNLRKIERDEEELITQIEVAEAEMNYDEVETLQVQIDGFARKIVPLSEIVKKLEVKLNALEKHSEIVDPLYEKYEKEHYSDTTEAALQKQQEKLLNAHNRRREQQMERMRREQAELSGFARIGGVPPLEKRR